MNSQQRTIDYYRRTLPKDTYGLSDPEVYGIFSEKMRNKGKNVPNFDQKLQLKPSVFNPEKRNTATKNQKNLHELAQVDTSPGAFDNLFTTHLSALFAKEGAFGASAEYWQDTYNKSFAGLVYQSMYGEPLYDVKDYDPGVMGHVTQFFMGMLSPLDIFAFSRMGKLGAASNKFATNKFVNSIAGKTIANSSKKRARIMSPFAAGAVSGCS